MALSPVARKFVLHWGEMGTKWGVNRSVAQIHALLYLSDRPLPAETICDELSLARSNVSTSLKELQGWGIVRVVHEMGDRRDHFESLTDVWEMFQIVLDERKRREIDPTVRLLQECLAELDRERRTKSNDLVRERLESMLDFMRTTSAWYQQMRKLPRKGLVKIVKMGSRLADLVSS